VRHGHAQALSRVEHIEVVAFHFLRTVGEVACQEKATTLFREPNGINNSKAREPNGRMQNTSRVGIALQGDATGRYHIQRLPSGQRPQPQGRETPGRFCDPSRPKADSYAASIDSVVHPKPLDDAGTSVIGDCTQYKRRQLLRQVVIVRTTNLTKRSASLSQEKYIGMDVHQATISVAVMDAGGKLIMECLLETKAATILEFIQGLQGTLSLTFEEGSADVFILLWCWFFSQSSQVNEQKPIVLGRSVLLSSKVSKQWPRSCPPVSDVPSRASFPWPAKPGRNRGTVPCHNWLGWPLL